MILRIFRRRFSVLPNHIGFLYKKNKLDKKLEPGIYRFYDWKRDYDLVAIPTTSTLMEVTNQEVLTKDNISFRFSYFVEFNIINPEKFIEKFNVLEKYFNATGNAFLIVRNYSQIFIREAIGEILSEELNEKKTELLNEVPEELNLLLSEYGIEIRNEILKDISFPKSIQHLFAKKLEAKIRAEADLENARSVVATARALKNASAMMKEDDNIRFIQLMETMTKISAKGNHTFVFSEAMARLKK